jgi:hypothetical protein
LKDIPDGNDVAQLLKTNKDSYRQGEALVLSFYDEKEDGPIITRGVDAKNFVHIYTIDSNSHPCSIVAGFPIDGLAVLRVCEGEGW